MRKVLGTIGVILAIVAVTAPATASGGNMSFVGPVDDAFFVGLGTVFD
jgi:hypothetical protein